MTLNPHINHNLYSATHIVIALKFFSIYCMSIKDQSSFPIAMTYKDLSAELELRVYGDIRTEVYLVKTF